MNTLNDISVGEIRKLQESLPEKTTIKEALPILRTFRDKHDISDKDALRACRIVFP